MYRGMGRTAVGVRGMMRGRGRGAAGTRGGRGGFVQGLMRAPFPRYSPDVCISVDVTHAYYFVFFVCFFEEMFSFLFPLFINKYSVGYN